MVAPSRVNAGSASSLFCSTISVTWRQVIRLLPELIKVAAADNEANDNASAGHRCWPAPWPRR